MPNQELNQYIKSQVERGVPISSLQQVLVDAGWDSAIVDEELRAFQNGGAAKQETPVTETPATAAVETKPVQQAAMEQPVAEAAQPMMQKPTTTNEPLDMFDEVEGGSQPVEQAQPMTMPKITPSEPQIQAQPTASQPARSDNPTNSQPSFMPAQPQMMQPGVVKGATGTEMPAGAVKDAPGSGTNIMQKPWFKYAAIAVGVVLLVGAAAAGVYAYASRTGNGDTQLQKAVGNFMDLKSASYSVVIAPEFSETAQLTNPLTQREVNEASLQITGAVQGLDTAAPATAATTSLKLIGGGATDSYTADIRTINGTNYVKFGDLTGVPTSTSSVIRDQWFSLTTQSIANLDTEKAGIDGRLLKPATQSEITQLKNALKDSNAVKMESRVGEEEIQGTETVKYSMTLTAAGVEKIISSSKSVWTAHGVSEQQIADIVKAMNEAGDLHGFIWIGKKDHQLYQMQFAQQFPQSNGLLKTVGVGITFWDHNKEVKIEIPSPVQPLDNLLLQLQSNNPNDSGVVTTNPLAPGIDTNANTNGNTNANDNGNENANANTNAGTNANTNASANENSNENTNTATEITPDANSDDDNDGLIYALELQYGSDPNKRDTDSDGYPDGEEVSNGYSPTGPGTLTNTNS